MPRQINMAATKFIVRFSEHISAKQVASMATGIAAYGNCNHRKGC
jgi:hypothetical protein